MRSSGYKFVHLPHPRILLFLRKCSYISFILHLDFARIFKGNVEQVYGLVYRKVPTATINEYKGKPYYPNYEYTDR